MNYRLDRQQKNSKKKRLAILLIVVLFLLVLVLAKKPAQKPVRTFAVSAWKTYNTVSDQIANGVAASLSSKKELLRRIDIFVDERKEYEQSLLRLRVLEEQNLELLEQLARKNDNETVLIAQVLTPPRKTLYKTSLLDAGAELGVSVGDFVYDKQVLIGIIDAVEPEVSVVSYFSAAGNTIDGLLLPDNIDVSLAGTGAGSYEVKIPRGVEVSEGDLIVERSVSKRVIAEVITIENDPRSPEITVGALAPDNPNNLDLVGILIN